MKAFMICLLLLVLSTFSFSQMPAAISIDPPDATAYEELTLIFDPAEACSKNGSLEGLDSIAIHSGVSFEDGQQWQYIIDFDAVGKNGQTTVLYPTGDGKYSITFTPFEFYGFPEGANVTEICAVFNNGLDWSSDGRDIPNCDDFFIPFSTGPNCLPNGINFYYQTQVDNFKSDYPGCKNIEGLVEISGGSITNLNGLDELNSIGGHLIVHKTTSLVNLTGLENLIKIGGNLNIGSPYLDNNLMLESLSGLENLNEIGGVLRIRDNDALEDITALGNLNSVGGYLWINDNPSLISLEGLEKINTVKTFLGVYRNDLLVNLKGLDELHYVDGEVLIGMNNSMISLDGINKLDSVLYGLDLWDNPILTDITALENLSSNRGYLWISENKLLTNLTGLENLSSVGDYIRIHENPVLTDITALGNIDPNSIIDLYIYENKLLSNCNIDNLCAYLSNPSGSINIYDNAIGCNNPVEVAGDCGIELTCLPHGNYYFTKQTDIDNFQSIYPECVNLEGMVSVSGNDILNLKGLHAISSINGTLDISDNEKLLTLSGLGNLSAINEYLTVSNNRSLINFEGIYNLTKLGGLYIRNDSSLINLTGLEKIDSIQNNVEIGREYTASGNPSLKSLSGLNNLLYVGGHLQIKQNDSLINLNGLDNLNTVLGDLSISHNDQLTNFTGLENLAEIGGHLLVGYSSYGEAGNPLLTSFTGLENLTSINGDLMITDNESLSNILSLNNLQGNSIQNLSIYENSSLSACEAAGICEYLLAPNGSIMIYNNSFGCNTSSEVELACEIVTIDEKHKAFTKTYPNPFSTSTTIEYYLNSPQKVVIAIYDQFGKEVSRIEESQQTGLNKIIWSPENLINGVYYFRLQTGEQLASGKVVLMR